MERHACIHAPENQPLQFDEVKPGELRLAFEMIVHENACKMIPQFVRDRVMGTRKAMNL